MDPRYSARYRELYEKHWWWRAREDFVVDEIQRLFPEGHIGPILDVGCGDGFFFPRLRSFGTPEGIESDRSLLTGAENPIHPGTIDSFRSSHRYRLILMLDVIEHVDDDIGMLRHARELLADEGRIIITVPALQVLWTHHDDLNQHRRRYSRRSLREAARGAGLSVHDVRSMFHWTVPAKLAVRAKEMMARGSGENVPPPIVNKLLYHFSRLELRLRPLQRFVPGSSLLMIASR